MATYEEVVLEDAPEIFLRLAETSGTNAADATRFGRDFTHSGSPTLNQSGPSGIGGSAVSYDGSNDETTYSATMPLTGFPLTIEYWAKTPGTTSSGTPYCAAEIADSSSNEQYFVIRLQTDGSNNLFVLLGSRNAGTTSVPTYSLPNVLKGQWVHIVARYTSATDRNVYINGVFIGQDTTSVPIPSFNRIGLGGFTARSTKLYYAGETAEPAFYNYELSEERIRIHHAVGRGHTDTDSYGYAMMTSGPVAWLRLQEASGTDAADASGNKRDFTHSGSPTLDQTGPLADGTTKAVSYDGTDDETTLSGAGFSAPSYPFSMGVWIKTPGTTTSGTGYCYFAFADSSVGNEFFVVGGITDGSNNLQVRALTQDSGGSGQALATIPDGMKGQWIYLTGVFRGTTDREIFANGVPLAINTGSSSPTLSNLDTLSLGKLPDSTPAFVVGELAEPAWFDRELSASEIRDIYAKGKQYLESDHRTKTLAKCPSIYWRQGESVGSTATDETEFGRDGTYAGTVTLEETGALVDDADTAALYDGTDGQLTYSEAFITQYPVTLEALVKLPDTPSSSTSYIRVGITDASGTMKMVAGLKTDSNTKLQAHIAEVGSSTGSTDNSCGGAVGNYHHLVAEFISDTSRKIWLNGVELEEETTSVSITLGNLDTICVGVEDLGTDAWYEGYCDEFVVYQRQLSTAEKRDQYLSGLGYFNEAVLSSDDSGLLQSLLEDAPALLWPQNETSGTDALAADRFGRDGTYANGFTLDQSGPHANYKAVNYDGTDGEAEYADANDIPIKGYPFCIASVLKTPNSLANSTDYAFFGIADSGGTDDEFGVLLRTDGSGNVFARGNIRIGGTDDHIDQNSGTGLSAQNSKFLYVVLVCRSATDRELYVNGRSAGTDATSLSFPSTLDTVAAGKLPTSSPSFHAGDQMMGMFFGYELTESQILKQTTAVRGVFEADNPYLYEVGQLVPAAHYRLNEASGEPADLLGLRDLTKAGAPTQSDADGPIFNISDDGQITFDGTDDAAARADSAQVTAYPVAYVGWLRTPSSPGTSSVFSQAGMGDDGTGDNVLAIALETDGSSNVTATGFLSTAGTADNLQPTSPVIEANVFHHIIWVQRSATDRELYVNGASVATDTTSRAFPSSLDDIILGRNAAASPAFYAGGVAEFSVLASDVSDAEALDLYLASFTARGIVPLGEVSVSITFGALAEIQTPVEISLNDTGMNTVISARVEIDEETTKDFRNVQSLTVGMGMVMELDHTIANAAFTTSKEENVDMVGEVAPTASFEQHKEETMGMVMTIEVETFEGSQTPTAKDLSEATIITVPKVDYIITVPRDVGERES